MKKIFILSILLVLPLYLFSETYKIKNAEYDINGAGFKFMGKTREYPLKRSFPLDTEKLFESREAFEKYLDNYKKSLESSRYFETVDVNYHATPSQDDLYEVTVLVKLQDSHHLVIMPYPKYSSNSGISVKLKAKDSNFFGSLNTMNAEINLKLDGKEFKPGFSFSFDAPFSMGPFDANFVNDYSINYIINDDNNGIEWDTETGLDLTLPFDRFSICLGIFQYTYRNFSYKQYGDDIYFSEKLNFGIPVKLVTLSNFTNISYSPSISINWNWDFDGINPDNNSLSGPTFSFSHSVSNGKVTWNDNFRKGYNLSLSNSFEYNIQRNDLVPKVSFDAQFFWNFQINDQDIWNRIGICSKLNIFHYFEIPSNSYKYGTAIGDSLRGILDDNYFGNNDPYQTASSAIVFNFDLPINVFTAYLPVEILNLNCQLSPFFDMALVYDRNKDRYFHPEDGFYCAGLEMLIYPLKWSSVTIRASLGINLSRNVFVEGLKNNKEIFIGIGRQY